MVPTRTRNHNGYVLLWDDEAILFDPGEGTQRQMTFAGVSATDLTRIAITHLHGDHSLGLAGVSQRISGDGVRHPIGVTYPASGQRWVNHLLDASAHHRRGHLELQPLTTDGVVPPLPGRPEPGFTLRAERLDHTIEAMGYRLDEPDGRSLDPALLARHGLAGPVVGELQRAGRVTTPDGRTVTLDDVSGPGPASRSRSSWTHACATPCTGSRTASTCSSSSRPSSTATASRRSAGATSRPGRQRRSRPRRASARSCSRTSRSATRTRRSSGARPARCSTASSPSRRTSTACGSPPPSARLTPTSRPPEDHGSTSRDQGSTSRDQGSTSAR